MFSTQRSNPGLLHCRQGLYRLSHQHSYIKPVSPAIYHCASAELSIIIDSLKCCWQCLLLGVRFLFSSVQFSRSVVSDSLRLHELQHTRPPCPSATPGVHSDSVHWVSDAIQPSHPLSSPSPLAPNPSQHQSLFQWVNSSREVTKVLEFQL